MARQSAPRPLPVVCALAALLLAGCEMPGQTEGPSGRVAPTLVPTTVPFAYASPATATGPIGAAGTPAAFQVPAAGGFADAPDVVARVQPAVVTVVNEQQGRGLGLGRGQALEAGRGTGFIVSTDGYVVTNEHVVEGGDQFEVILADGQKRPAKVIGADRVSDIAVIQISGPLPAVVAFGDSDALRPGQPVLAIGSPLGEFSGTVTNGIVSGLHRDFPGAPRQGEADYTNLIQHNAAINPGNSGGPLFDLNGRVVGVNTLGIPVVPGENIPAQGLFFAIPSNTVQKIVGQLIDKGRVSYPYLGVEAVSISPDVAAANNLPVDYGAYLTNVVPDGPADKAGLQTGDIILAIGDRRIDAQTTFTDALFAYQPGDTVSLTIQRGAGQRQIQVTLAERPDQNP